MVPRSAADGGSIDSFIHVGSFIGQGASGLRQRDCAFVEFVPHTTSDCAIAADRRNGGEWKRFDQLDVADQPHDQPIEPDRHRQLVELFDRAKAIRFSSITVAARHSTA